MRLRYERRDPRPEDLRYIDELKSIVDSQERDIYHLTEQLRESQLVNQQIMQQQNIQIQPNSRNRRHKNKNKQIREQQQQQIALQQLNTQVKNKLHQTNCNVIYEENEAEMESGTENPANVFRSSTEISQESTNSEQSSDIPFFDSKSQLEDNSNILVTDHLDLD